MKIHEGIGVFFKVRNFVNYQILRSLYYAFFQSHIDYCFNIWTCTAPSLLEPINVSMKKGIRAISFTKHDSHSDPLFKSNQLLNFTELQTLHLSMFEWDLHHNNLPNTIYTILNRNNNAACRTKLPSYKYIPLYRTKYKKYFITTRSVPIWRDLPNKLKTIKNKKYFMKTLKKIPIRSIILNPPYQLKYIITSTNLIL